ncbi:MAG: TROVE domain-containing protein [Flavipsychrobacter sp.]
MRFNIFKRKANEVSNYEAAKAYRLTPELELYTAVATSGLSDSFYEKATDRLERIKLLMQNNDADFIARLATYARSEMHLRSIPLVLAVELAKQNTGNELVRKTVTKVVQRADEITELLAYYQMANKREGIKKLNKLSKQIQKGLADSFNSFDEYQFAKYDRATEVSLRDALFLVHPKAKDEAQQIIFDKIARKELATPYTWETELSALGQQNFKNAAERTAAFRVKWEELVFSRKLGYMAMLRNLRNILGAGCSYECINAVCDTIADAGNVARSKQLPFRFLAAYREIKVLESADVSAVLTALEAAAQASASNFPGFDESTRVLVACDVSGSMQKPVSAKSKILLYDVGLMLAMLLQSRCKRVVSGMFGNTWKVVNVPGKNILANVNEYYKREGEVGYATNGYLVINYLVNKRIAMDKVMLFTDCQLWNSNAGNNHIEASWKQYKRLVPHAKLYLFDLAGYGNSPVRTLQEDVYLIAGWSDKVFGVLSAIENGQDVIQKIKEMEL